MDSHFPIRLFLVSPHPIMLIGLERLIESRNASVRIVGSALTAGDAIGLLESVAPDVILFDIDFGSLSFIEEIPQFIAKSKAKVLVVTGIQDDGVHDKSVLAGASGVVQKTVSGETILSAIGKVHEGQFWLDHAATRRIFLEFSRQRSARTADPVQADIAELTHRERQIVSFTASRPGANAKVIAESLCISEHTLRNHLTSIYSKLNVSSRLELFAYAIKNGLTERSS
jgi:two-component system, NarL family, nitrate/nitrite response regulator NarL